MRRATNLFDRIPAWDNLRLAFYKAARGRRGQIQVRQFAADLDHRLRSMANGIWAGTVTVGKYQQFLIRDPKERVITAPSFDERVLHHAIMNVCEPIFDRWLIDDTFACRVGKGREAAVQRAAKFTCNDSWFLKLDVRKYFDSVSHERLMTYLNRRLKDRQLLNLLLRIIHAYRGEFGVGLPIGSLTSQHFANFYLGWLDRLIKETLRVRGYVRYMDDMILWHPNRETLANLEAQCRDFAATQLLLRLKPAEIRHTESGVPLLGCRVYPSHVELNRGSKRRWRRRVKILLRAERLGLITQLEVQQRLMSLTAFATAAGARSCRFRHGVLENHVVDGP